MSVYTFDFVDKHLLGKKKWTPVYPGEAWTYWARYGKDAIDLIVGHRVGRNRGHNPKRLLRLYRDGRVTMSANLLYWSWRRRANSFNPFNDKWYIAWRWKPILCKGPDQSYYWQVKDNGIVINDYQVDDYDRYIYFNADGSLRYPVRGERFKTLKRRKFKEYNRRNAELKRGWYWQNRARNLYLDESKCDRKNPEKIKTVRSWERWTLCKASRWMENPPQTYSCGCRTYRKNHRPFKKTVNDILNEPNATIKACWMQLYGLGKFFIDANARRIASSGEYELLDLTMSGPVGFGGRDNLRALKMTCPSTGTVHINAVPPDVTTISMALDWMFNIPQFQYRVGQQT